MPRISEITQAGADPALQAIFDKERSAYGEPLNPSKVMAHCPPLLQAAKSLTAAIEQSGLLPATLAPLVYLRVATINGCPF
jgi:alkylhydroperoxidase family enzyme